MGYSKIARTLIEKGIPSRFGSWTHTSVRDILTNEKYAGNMLLQKSFVEDFRTKRQRKNTGEMRRVYVKNCHEAIIDKQTFDDVQAEIARRGHHQEAIMERRNTSHDNSEKLFTGLITCGDCGGAFLRKYTNAKISDRPVWVCQRYFKYGKAVCTSQRIPETILIEKTCEVLGGSEISREMIIKKICRILVSEHNRLIYELRDGTTVDVAWEHPSRKLSWTDEMRQAAREKAIKQHQRRKNEHNAGN